jgi:hypothetical protein
MAENECVACANTVPAVCRLSAIRSRVRSSARETEFVKSFEIVGRCDDFPLTFNLANSSQQELPEADSLLDNAEHWFDGAFAFAVDLASITCTQRCLAASAIEAFGARAAGS